MLIREAPNICISLRWRGLVRWCIWGRRLYELWTFGSQPTSECGIGAAIPDMCRVFGFLKGVEIERILQRLRCSNLVRNLVDRSHHLSTNEWRYIGRDAPSKCEPPSNNCTMSMKYNSLCSGTIYACRGDVHPQCMSSASKIVAIR